MALLFFKRGLGVRGGGEETNISKYGNNFLSTNLTTLILSSLVTEFLQIVQGHM